MKHQSIAILCRLLLLSACKGKAGKNGEIPEHQIQATANQQDTTIIHLPGEPISMEGIIGFVVVNKADERAKKEKKPYQIYNKDGSLWKSFSYELKEPELADFFLYWNADAMVFTCVEKEKERFKQ